MSLFRINKEAVKSLPGLPALPFDENSLLRRLDLPSPFPATVLCVVVESEGTPKIIVVAVPEEILVPVGEPAATTEAAPGAVNTPTKFVRVPYRHGEHDLSQLTVVARNGTPLTIITTSARGDRPIRGYINESGHLSGWNVDGGFADTNTPGNHPMDLFVEVESEGDLSEEEELNGLATIAGDVFSSHLAEYGIGFTSTMCPRHTFEAVSVAMRNAVKAVLETVMESDEEASN